MSSSTTEIDAQEKAKRSKNNIRRRRAAETRFKAYGVVALATGIFFLALLLYSIITQGYYGFVQAQTKIEVKVDEQLLDPDNRRANLDEAGMRELLIGKSISDRFRLIRAYNKMVDDGLARSLGVADDEAAKKALSDFLSNTARQSLRQSIIDDPSLIGTTLTRWVTMTADVDGYLKGNIRRSTPENIRKLNDAQLDLIDRMDSEGLVALRFNTGLFTNPTNPDAEAAGLAVALIGSLQMMVLVLLMALPVGIAASIYLEEFAPKNRFTDLIEVNINNLAAVPSIVFGILGLAIFINYMGLPRSAPLVGGMVLALMTLPTIIIATRASLKAVPPSVREAALGVGASKMQSIFHHVLPLAMPGILTGTIIGLAQALGETAPLLMIGMDAAVLNVPEIYDVTAPATSMPSQIYHWASEDDRTAFDPRTSAAIMVLLGFLTLMNLSAVLLRRRFERRW